MSARVRETDQRYKRLVELISQTPRSGWIKSTLLLKNSFLCTSYAVCLCNVCAASDYDRLASTLVNITSACNATFLLIDAVLAEEFRRTASDSSTTLRNNSMAAKIMGAYTRIDATFPHTSPLSPFPPPQSY